MNWTQIVITIVNAAAAVLTAAFAAKAKANADSARGSAFSAGVHADVAKAASLAPPPDRATPVDPSVPPNKAA